MKKFYSALVAMFIAVTASAQVYVGGQVGLWRNTDANHTSFNIAPEVGYNLSDKWAIGTEISYDYDYSIISVYDAPYGLKTTGVGFAPYVRYTAAKFGPVSLIFDGGFGFMTYKYKYKCKCKYNDYDYDNERLSDNKSYNAWKIGVTPGVKVSLAKNVDFIASLGFLGYRDNDDVKGLDVSPVFGEKGFGFSFSSQDLQFGVIYNF